MYNEKQTGSQTGGLTLPPPVDCSAPTPPEAVATTIARLEQSGPLGRMPGESVTEYTRFRQWERECQGMTQGQAAKAGAVRAMPLLIISNVPLLVSAVTQVSSGWVAFVSAFDALCAFVDLLLAGSWPWGVSV